MDHFRKIYTDQAAEYHHMIHQEDADGNLLPALQEIVNLTNATLLDLGSGSGRIPILTHTLVNRVIALDLYFPMLAEQAIQQAQLARTWPLVNADNRRLPFPGNWVDVITAGWTIGHLRDWYPQDWQDQMGSILAEMERVVVPGGTVIILETLSTGSLTPAPPNPGLAEYYHWLETKWDYTHRTIQTDYQFATLEQAIARTEFFFGPEMGALIRANNWTRLPEWTGVWFKQIPG